MQYLKVTRDMTREDLESRVLNDDGSGMNPYVDVYTGKRVYVPNRQPNSGEIYEQALAETFSNYVNSPPISAQEKAAKLNKYSNQKDIFDHLCQMSELEWVVFYNTGIIPGYLGVMDHIIISDGDDVLGLPSENENPVPMATYVSVMRGLEENGEIPTDIFGEYSAYTPSVAVDVLSDFNSATSDNGHPLWWANLPNGDVALHSMFYDSSAPFPVYPNGYEDGVQANYETMPETIYQYEPWQVYTSSGPRSMSFTFDMHRDMWDNPDGHYSGACERLIAFCKATCYARYRGAAVDTDIVTLYINGKKIIRGIMTSVKDVWDGDSPLGYDGLPLHVTLTLSITEVSDEPLSNESVHKGWSSIR